MPGRFGEGSGNAADPQVALARAVDAAAAAARFGVVAQLAKELEARRLARTNVVRLEERRRVRS
jgi:hypothetical protein